MGDNSGAGRIVNNIVIDACNRDRLLSIPVVGSKGERVSVERGHRGIKAQLHCDLLAFRGGCVEPNSVRFHLALNETHGTFA